ncbi:hypothetical protein [Moellerella wisconsensis]|uniref:hypothetical protein n=1 Tax=Moellerella wisconsensis TaxID=158849 RepID=UPI0030762B43
MNEQDVELYHHMLNVELKFVFNNKLRTNYDEFNFPKFVIKEFKDLKRKKKISLSLFKFFNNAFIPNQSGFLTRWFKRFKRYGDIYKVNERLNGCTVEERLEMLFSKLNDYQFVIKKPHNDNIEFYENESPHILSFGFVGIHSNELVNIKSGSNEIMLTYYIGTSGIAAETLLIYQLQNYGFNISLELQRSQTRLAHNEFSYLFIEPFYEKLSLCSKEIEK